MMVIYFLNRSMYTHTDVFTCYEQLGLCFAVVMSRVLGIKMGTVPIQCINNTATHTINLALTQLKYVFFSSFPVPSFCFSLLSSAINVSMTLASVSLASINSDRYRDITNINSKPSVG